MQRNSESDEAEGAADEMIPIADVFRMKYQHFSRTQGDDQCVEGVDQVPRSGRPAAGGHQRADRQRIERLVQHDGQKGAARPTGRARRRSVQR